MNNVKNLLDIEAIKQVRFKWASALDYKDWNLFAFLLAEKSDTDFSDWGMAPQKMDKLSFIKLFSEGAFKKANLKTQHNYTSFKIEINGNTATSVCNYIAFHYLEDAEGGSEYNLFGEYTDRLQKVDGKWLIIGVTFKLFFLSGNPKVLQ